MVRMGGKVIYGWPLREMCIISPFVVFGSNHLGVTTMLSTSLCLFFRSFQLFFHVKCGPEAGIPRFLQELIRLDLNLSLPHLSSTLYAYSYQPYQKKISIKNLCHSSAISCIEKIVGRFLDKEGSECVK